MPKKLTGYEKVINKCKKIGWLSYPEYDENFNYDELYQLIKYGNVKIKIAITKSPKNWNEYYNLILEYKKFKRGVFLEKLIYIYGDIDGRKKFNSYCEKQAITNTFEYKNKKYGMSLEEFNEYNKSRAVTLENLINKHGEELGEKKYKSYCEKQAYTNSKDYLGEEKFKEVGRKKSHTLEVYIERYGKLEAEKKLLEFYQKSSPMRRHSNISQDFFNRISIFLNETEKENSYYATKNSEYCLIAEDKIFFYDFVCKPLNLCIEYHGDHYHGNPKIYRPDEYLKGRGCTKIKAKDKWRYDTNKMNLLKEMRGYDTIVIWDLDWRKYPEDILVKIENLIKSLRAQNEVNYAC